MLFKLNKDREKKGWEGSEAMKIIAHENELYLNFPWDVHRIFPLMIHNQPTAIHTHTHTHTHMHVIYLPCAVMMKMTLTTRHEQVHLTESTILIH